MKNANLLSWSLFCLLLAIGPLWTGCKGENSRASSAAEKPANTFFTIPVGTAKPQIQLAVTEGEMTRGLMGRKDLGPDQGMLFLYSRPQQMSFWMRNTPTALDIGFFDRTGTLREVYPMYPYDERSVKSVAGDLMYALEMNQGWFSANGVRPGAKLDLLAVAKALRERGFTGKGVEENDTPAPAK